MSIFALENISPLIDAESSKSASAPINGAIGPDFWTHYIIEIIMELIIIKKNNWYRDWAKPKVSIWFNN